MSEEDKVITEGTTGTDKDSNDNAINKQEDQSISVEEYMKLQLEYIDSQKELKEITELFEQYRQETESMEAVQIRQVEMLEQQLEKANLEKEYLMLTLKKELQEIQLETQKLLMEKEEEVQKLRMEIKMKTITITKFLSDYQDEKDKKEDVQGQQESTETEAETIKKLKKELAVKDFLIDDLSQDIEKNRKIMEEQKNIFKKFSAEILEKTKERDNAMKEIKDQEITELKSELEDKDELIAELEKQVEGAVSTEETKLMREMIFTQQEKLLSLTKNFEGYRNESEKMFLGQIALRDNRIKVLEDQKDKEIQNQASENKAQDNSEDGNKSASTQNEITQIETQEEKQKPE